MYKIKRHEYDARRGETIIQAVFNFWDKVPSEQHNVIGERIFLSADRNCLAQEYLESMGLKPIKTGFFSSLIGWHNYTTSDRTYRIRVREPLTEDLALDVVVERISQKKLALEEMFDAGKFVGVILTGELPN